LIFRRVESAGEPKGRPIADDGANVRARLPGCRRRPTDAVRLDQLVAALLSVLAPRGDVEWA
jgi:hypothetical protein